MDKQIQCTQQLHQDMNGQRSAISPPPPQVASHVCSVPTHGQHIHIELRNIHKSYGSVHANQGITLTLAPGRIYGLLGENAAGKSTLMRMLAGYSQPDFGEILLNGRLINLPNPRAALAAGVGMLHHEPMDFPALRVSEAFGLGRPLCSQAEAISRLQIQADRFGLTIDPMTRIAELTVGERQQLELLRLLDLGVHILILYEPTIGISDNQKDILFTTLRQLTADGHVVILITHALTDAQTLCDEVLIMRQGLLVGQLPAPFSPDKVTKLMFGEDIANSWHKSNLPPPKDEIAFALKAATFSGDTFELTGVSVTARAGEIIGLAGLEGNGQKLLLNGLAGLVPLTAGHMQLTARNVTLVPAARMEEGLFPDMTVYEQLAVAFPDRARHADELFKERYADNFQMAAKSDIMTQKLSGGNQQRLQLALIPDSARCILMEHPTYGLDMNSKHSVWRCLHKQVTSGTTIVFYSTDLDEILFNCHRVLIFYGRQIFADRLASTLDKERLAALIMGQDDGGKLKRRQTK
ncbi:ABC transporter related protein [Desulfovibrionales bacterium]